MLKNKIIIDIMELKEGTLNKYIEAERQNRYIASKIKKRLTEKMRKVFLQALVDDNVPDWPAKIKCDWYLPDERLDPDNWVFTMKFILDGAQLAKYGGKVFLSRDSFKNIKGFDHDMFIDRKNPRLEFYIVENADL